MRVNTVDSITKIIEIVLSLIGIILLEFVPVFYARWVYEMLIISLGGYLLICCVLLLTIIRNELSTLMDKCFMVVGCILNIIGGVITLVRYDGRHEFVKGNWFVVTDWVGARDKKYQDQLEMGVGIVALLLGLVMLWDCLKEIILSKCSRN
ncbi:hypothetical protein JTB14_027842 [Gonioctena quinquepunctata]|nr:hypothetical protein JTB14_027842 [Gonioctena quinquepunctata]